MGAEDPEQAILDKLGGPVGVWEPHSVSSGGIQSGTVRGGNLERADLSTVRFVKHRRSERRHLYFVTYVRRSRISDLRLNAATTSTPLSLIQAVDGECAAVLAGPAGTATVHAVGQPRRWWLARPVLCRRMDQ